jgi:hypothetical protein
LSMARPLVEGWDKTEVGAGIVDWKMRTGLPRVGI